MRKPTDTVHKFKKYIAHKDEKTHIVHMSPPPQKNHKVNKSDKHIVNKSDKYLPDPQIWKHFYGPQVWNKNPLTKSTSLKNTYIVHKPVVVLQVHVIVHNRDLCDGLVLWSSQVGIANHHAIGEWTFPPLCGIPHLFSRTEKYSDSSIPFARTSTCLAVKTKIYEHNKQITRKDVLKMLSALLPVSTLLPSTCTQRCSWKHINKQKISCKTWTSFPEYML